MITRNIMTDSNEIQLTKIAGLHGCACKRPEGDLEKLLEGVQIHIRENEKVLLGIGDDAGAIQVRDDLAYVTHLDFFTPIIDDPYLYGLIATCNAASDVFVKGAIENIGILVIMGFPLKVPLHMLEQMLQGVKDFCAKVDGHILGGHTIINSWPILGAAVTATIHPHNLISNSRAKPGDLLILTKPLGGQVAMGAIRAINQMKDEVTSIMTEENILSIADFAVRIMTTTNKAAAMTMLEQGVHASTDVTGFGLMGQARLMAKRSGVNIKITSLPVIEGTPALSALFGYGLEKGESAETSGGVLLALPRKKKEKFTEALERRNTPAYEIGVIQKGEGEAILARDKKIIEIPTTSSYFNRASSE